MRAEELVFLGMVPPPKSKSHKNMPVHVAKKVEVRKMDTMFKIYLTKISGEKKASSGATRERIFACKLRELQNCST